MCVYVCVFGGRYKIIIRIRDVRTYVEHQLFLIIYCLETEGRGLGGRELVHTSVQWGGRFSQG